jgi:hypothetical protein
LPASLAPSDCRWRPAGSRGRSTRRHMRPRWSASRSR